VLGCRVRYDETLYAAVAERLLEVVRTLSDRDETVMLVGHNPSLEELTAMLCGHSPNYPTAALGTVDLSIERWGEVSPGCGTLAAFVTATQLEAMS
jgi:phosphohistidine phosphatase